MHTWLLYCVGPITGVSYGESVDWREYVAENLPPEITAVSPMRGKAYLEKEKSVKASYEDIPLSSAKGITTRDLFDVRRADMVLANFIGATKVSIGSVMEITLAHAYRKPIIIVMEKDNVHRHPMLEQISGFVVETLDEAIEIAKAVLLPTL